MDYVFTSARLGFRNWIADDIPKMIEISGSEKVMEFFPYIATPIQTEEFIVRMLEMYERTGFCYFAVERLDTTEFIGFIGLCEQNFDVEFCPCIDLGWRLSPKHWNLGFATEGAKRCLDYGHSELSIDLILSTAPEMNIKSLNIMRKIGMIEKVRFNHPRIGIDHPLEKCICFSSKLHAD